MRSAHAGHARLALAAMQHAKHVRGNEINRMEALEGGPHPQEPAMLSSTVRPRPLHLSSRPTKGSGTSDPLQSLINFLGILPEVFAEAQEMKRQAKQRYPFMSFDC